MTPIACDQFIKALCRLGTLPASGFELIDIEKMLALLISAAFVAGFALVVLNASQVAFSRSPTGTAPVGGGAPVTIWTFTGHDADDTRDHMLLLVYTFSLLLGFYVAVFAVGLVAEACLQSLRYVASEGERMNGQAHCSRTALNLVVCLVGDVVRPRLDSIRWGASQLVVKPETLQFFFACLWLGMIWAIMSILRGRMNLAHA